MTAIHRRRGLGLLDHPTEIGKNLEAAERDPDRWKIDPENGAARYTGRGKRGGPSHEEADDGDLADAIRELCAARAMLGEAYRMTGGRARREAIAAAVAKAALAGRFVDDLVLRRGGRCPDVEHDERTP